MSIVEVFHKLILGPIELLLDVIYSLSLQMTDSPALSIVVLSLAINLLVLPLYIKADAMQQEERNISMKLKPRIDQIKRVFSGDERFMILQSFYRQNHYKPFYVLRGSLSLLLQIPFFMAAYNFLSGLNALQGVSFGPISNLGAPDGMLKIGGVAINVLPILMTIINIISGIIYTKGMPLKSKIQLHGMAFLFLILLYNSPAGLVLYWTLNNVFSLGKNIFNKLPNSKKVIRIVCSGIGFLFFILFIVRFEHFGIRKAIWGIVAAVILQTPLLVHLYHTRHKKIRKQNGKINSSDSSKIFYICCVLLTVLTGVLIPSAVIHASPAEFVETNAFRNPLEFVFHAFLLAAGTFLIWCVIFYLLAPEAKRPLFSLFFVFFSTIAIINYMFFGNGYGNMSSILVYDGDVADRISTIQKIANGAIIAAVGVIIAFLWRKRRIILKGACILECLAITGMSIANIASTSRQIPEIERLVSQNSSIEGKIIDLNRNGKNVIVFMLDRAVGYFVPFLFQEKPELKEQFEGFVFYPNTLSYGHSTNVGTPPLFGGYEYLPQKINQRTDELLKDKQNEALKVMPVLFLEQNYEVTVCDPPYANYQWYSDLSIYNEYSDIRGFVTDGKYSDDSGYGMGKRNQARERNLFCYSIFRISPILIQSELYDGGNYNKTDRLFTRNDYSIFLESYMVLKKLPEITNVQNSSHNTFLMINNNTTHEPTILQEPEYEPREYVDNSQYDRDHEFRYSGDGRRLSLTNETQLKHYQSNMAALLQLGKWMDYLREQDVYDNTRIIIVADHGRNLGYQEMNIKELDVNIMSYNPLFMVKDFDSNQPFRISDEFMTNADTPTIAMNGLIENPINPFTQQAVTDNDKKNNEQIVCDSPWDTAVNNGYTFSNPVYYSISNQDIFNQGNWNKVE